MNGWIDVGWMGGWMGRITVSATGLCRGGLIPGPIKEEMKGCTRKHTNEGINGCCKTSLAPVLVVWHMHGLCSNLSSSPNFVPSPWPLQLLSPHLVPPLQLGFPCFFQGPPPSLSSCLTESPTALGGLFPAFLYRWGSSTTLELAKPVGLNLFSTTYQRARD
jgi:hypothetical protein